MAAFTHYGESVSSNLARRDLFLGQLRESRTVIRPPYARPERRFLELCTGCDDCAKACTNRLIGMVADSTPKMLFGVGECSFCGDCERACKTGALDAKKARPWRVIADIRAGCLSFNGIVCRACGEGCEAAAIFFRLMTNGRALPLVNRALCTGCGACAALCPNESVSMIEDQQDVKMGRRTA